METQEQKKRRIAAYFEMWHNYAKHGMISNGNKETDCLPYLKDDDFNIKDENKK